LGGFFTSVPAVLSSATPDMRDTTHTGQASYAQCAWAGQPGLRRTVREIFNLCPFFVHGGAGFVLTSVNQNGTS